MINAKEKLNQLRLLYGTFSKKECDEKTSKKYEKLLEQDLSYNLPANVECKVSYDDGKTRFYCGIESDLTENEIYEFIEYKKIGLLKTIKNCILFFTICSIIGIVLYLCSIISIL